MGNVSSAATADKRRPQWSWEYRNGRYRPKPTTAGGANRPKLKWTKQRSDNYDWWIFNPDRKNDSNDEWPAIFQKKRGRSAAARGRVA